MAIVSVIKFEGGPDQLIWKSPVENFNAMSQLIVDETHEALLVVNGAAADLFGPGSHTLSVPNLPILRSLVSIPTGGETLFPCKIFYINKVHQMDMLWGTQSPIALQDPLYDIFMHVLVHGSMSISVTDSRKFLLKIVGFRNNFDADALVSKFRGIISTQVKNCVATIMINGMLSYFIMNAHLMEISEVMKEKLDQVFQEYGVEIPFFNIESIEVPKNDYAAITEAKNLRSSRLIQGYTWQEERQMLIAEKFASNEGAMGTVGGMMGGAMGGIMMGGTISELARNALSMDRIPTQAPPKDVSDYERPMGGNSQGNCNIRDILSGGMQAAPERPQPKADDREDVPENTMGKPTENGLDGGLTPFSVEVETSTVQPVHADGKYCPHCGAELNGNPKFCSECGHALKRTCPNCGAELNGNPKFCSECGYSLT